MSPETDNTEAKASKMAIWYRFNATSEIFIVKWLDNKCVITWQSSATDKRNEEQSQWHFTCFRSEKWSWSLFMRIIYVITNAWIIHKFVNKDKKQFINVLDFKKDICLAYLKPSSERPSGVRKDGTPNLVLSKMTSELTWEGTQMARRMMWHCLVKPRSVKPPTLEVVCFFSPKILAEKVLNAPVRMHRCNAYIKWLSYLPNGLSISWLMCVEDVFPVSDL